MLGTALSTLEQAPVNDPTWEIWACSPFFTNRKIRIDRFFEIHPLVNFHKTEVDHYIPWMASLGKPVYVFDDLGLPNQVYYPRTQIERTFETSKWAFTSTIAWMVALAMQEALVEGWNHIGLWGVDMSTDAEYGIQKSGLLHLITLARLQGITVEIPQLSELLRLPAPYPDRYATEIALTLKQREDMLAAQFKECEALFENMKLSREYLRGQLEIVRHLQRTLV